MVAWEISRHPEWDRMYLAGLTAREISDLCHQKISTVHRHLRVREKYQEDFKETHYKELASRHPDRPSTQWRIRLNELNEFVVSNGRLPERNGNQHEISLYSWLSIQRASHYRGAMSPGKTYLLGSIPNWCGSSREEILQHNWMNNLNETADYVTNHKEMPRYKNFSDDREHKLGVWLHIQHQKRSQGTLSEARFRALERFIPGWRSRQ